MKRFQKLPLFICGLIIVYVLLYSTLSLNGRYEPMAVDLRGIMWSSWAPAEFYDPDHPWPNSVVARKSKDKKTGGWSPLMIYAFLPLWQIDIHFIHKDQWGPH
jgi:hypothetical protein